MAGVAVCAAICGWVLHTARFQLTVASYPALNAAHVPADLVAELKRVEATSASTDQQFVDDLSTHLGQDHIAPYRDALLRACWNCHQKVALAASAGLCACFSLVLGRQFASRSRS
jgi:hypothetical protein